jgi:hypothetical protein
MLKALINTISGYRYIIIYTSIVHVVWGCLLFVEDGVGRVTALTVANSIFGGLDKYMYILLTIAAIYGLHRMDKGEMITFIGIKFSPINLVWGQQLLLYLSAVAAIMSVYNSAFGDGQVRSRIFIASAQFHHVLLAVMHTIALLDLHKVYAKKEVG